MKFPQNGSLFRDYLLSNLILGIAWVFCTIVLLQSGDVREMVLVSVFIAASMGMTALDWHLEKNKIICLDENGICLTVKGKQEWAFSWDEIAHMTYGSKYRHKSVCIEPKAPPKQDPSKPSGLMQYHFQLSKAAKQALTRYCPLPIQK